MIKQLYKVAEIIISQQDRDDLKPMYEEKRKRPDSDHDDTSRSSKSAQNGEVDRKANRGSSSSASSSSRKFDKFSDSKSRK